MVLQQTFTFATDGNDTFESSAFTVEHYEGTLTSGAVENTTTFNVSFDTAIFNLITPGTKLFLGPSSKTGFVGESERVTVSSTGAGNQITLSGPLTNGFVSGDKVVFSKNLWVFNQNFQTTTGVGALYKISALDGSISSRTQGGAFKDINATTFHELTSFTGSLASFNKPYIVFIRTTNLLFIDPTDSNLPVSLSSVQNNINAASTEVFDVSDIGIEGDTIFRLQQKFNINGSESTETTFNYQLATFKPFPTAIALTATPAILPADSGASTSVIVATVTDQYFLAFVTSPAATIQFSTSGGGAGSGLSDTGQISLDSNGQATVTYTTGNTPGLVSITATVTI
jgi:predicted transport protein